MIKSKKKMLTKEDLVKILKTEQPKFKEEFGVKRLAIFGSFAKGKPSVKSDVDIFVEFSEVTAENFFGLLEYLEKKLGRNVDLLTLGAMQNMRVKIVAENIKRSMIHV